MGKIVMSEFVSLDGVIQDPDGNEGFRVGGWVGQLKDREELYAVKLGKAGDAQWPPRAAASPTDVVAIASLDGSPRCRGDSLEIKARPHAAVLGRRESLPAQRRPPRSVASRVDESPGRPGRRPLVGR